MRREVLVAMSGGVDSSVAAYLLKNKGYDIAGITMLLGSGTSYYNAQAVDDAKRVCHTLSIPHYVVDFSGELDKYVIDPFITGYMSGRTPNPCTECNRRLKFGCLLAEARRLGFAYLATGHYAAKKQTRDGYFLEIPFDCRKDQTYFLYGIQKKSLQHILFPLAVYTKKDVLEIARKARLPVHNKSESQDICFIPGGNYRTFLEQRGVKGTCGSIETKSGMVIGQHRGLVNYTIGQRRGLRIGYKEPLYVVAIDVNENKLIVGSKREILSEGIIAESINYFTDVFPKRGLIKMRYNSVPAVGDLQKNNTSFRIDFSIPQTAVTPGQAVVIYQKDIILGGGTIVKSLKKKKN